MPFALSLNMTAITVVFMIVVVPVWLILHYGAHWKRKRTLSPEDEIMLGELHQSAGKLEQRLDALERILDDEMPEWRRADSDTL